jgi:hypothetical protein
VPIDTKWIKINIESLISKKTAFPMFLRTYFFKTSKSKLVFTRLLTIILALPVPYCEIEHFLLAYVYGARGPIF